MAVELNIFDEIGWDASKDNVVRAFKDAGGQDVIINVSSGGGSVFEGLSIAGLISQYSGKTTGIGIGIVASAATIVLLSCEEKKMLRNSFFMIHNSWGLAGGDATDMEKSAELLKKIDEQMAKIYTAQIKSAGKLVDESEDKTLAKVKKMMEAETWLTAEEALDLGLIDGIVEEDKKYNSLYQDTFAKVRAEAKQFKNIPKKIASMASEKKTLLEQMAIWLGLKAEITEDTEVKTEVNTEVNQPEVIAEVEPEKVIAESVTDSEQSELETKLAEIKKQVETKQKELESIEAEIKAKINYKSEPKITEAKAETGFTQDQIAQASAFINSLFKN
jgi:ATP-dependent protease ClpP protease subunit